MLAMSLLNVKGVMLFFGAFAGKISDPLDFPSRCSTYNLLRWISLCRESMTDVRGVSNFCCLNILKQVFRCFYIKNFNFIHFEINELMCF